MLNLLFQTTVAQILCNQELVQFGRKHIFYICFSKNSTGQGLRDWVGDKENVTFLNRNECCERFNINDDGDNIKMIEHIIQVAPPETVLLFDEVPLASSLRRSKTPYDWSSLKNKRPQEVTAVISLQPLLIRATPKGDSQIVKGPIDAHVVELSSQYRNTNNISGFVNHLCRKELPIIYADVPFSSTHDLGGPGVEVVFMAELKQSLRLRGWLCNQLQQELACKPSQVRMIHVSNTEQLAKEVVRETVYEGSLTRIDDFQGCETPVAVVFFSEAPGGGDYSQLLEMCSRAQYKLILVIFDNPYLHDMIANVGTETSVVDIENIRESLQQFLGLSKLATLPFCDSCLNVEPV